MDKPQRSAFRMPGSITGPDLRRDALIPNSFRASEIGEGGLANHCPSVPTRVTIRGRHHPLGDQRAERLSPGTVADDHSGSRSQTAHHLHHGVVFAQDSRKKGRARRQHGSRIGNGCDEGRVGAGGGPTAMAWGRPRSDDQCPRPRLPLRNSFVKIKRNAGSASWEKSEAADRATLAILSETRCASRVPGKSNPRRSPFSIRSSPPSRRAS